MTRLSIIVPVYNAERFLDRAVASVRAQTVSDWELILVDDGSTDGSPALLERYAGEDGRIRAFRQRNAGPSAARNPGMAEARGEYLAFLDADDYLAPECYAAMFAALDMDNADCACCGYRFAGDGGPFSGSEPVPPPLPAGTHGPDAVRDALVLPLLQDRLREGAVTGMVWRWLFRREAVEALGLRFAGGYYEDEMFLIRYFAAAPRRLACAEGGLYYYYQSPFSVTHRYFPGFTEQYLRILEEKASAIREYRLPVREDWRDNCAWAGLLAAVGNEFAPGSPEGARTHRENLKALCAVPAFSHALAHYAPAGMNRRKRVVAALLRRKMFFALVALYAVKNRNRGG